jgi:hypothetical protein
VAGRVKCKAIGLVQLNINFKLLIAFTQLRKAFDVLAEGLLSENSRGDWIPIELFVQGIERWGEDTKRLVMAA